MNNKADNQYTKELEGQFAQRKAALITERLEYLREQIKGECISYGEIVELQTLAGYIPAGDVELLQWAGVEEEATTSAFDSFCEIPAAL